MAAIIYFVICKENFNVRELLTPAGTLSQFGKEVDGGVSKTIPKL